MSSYDYKLLLGEKLRKWLRKSTPLLKNQHIVL